MGGQVQGSQGLATHRTPNLTLPMMLPISCKGREEWHCQEVAPCLPHPSSAHSLATGKPCPRDTGTLGDLSSDTGAWECALPWLRMGKAILLGMLFPGETGSRGRKLSMVRSWSCSTVPQPSGTEPPGLTLPCMSILRVRVMLSSASSGLPPTPAAPSGDAMAGGRDEPVGHGALQKRGCPS